MARIVIPYLLIFLFASCGYSPKSPAEANNTVAPVKVVKSYFRALELGQWDEAEALLADNYRFRPDGDTWLPSSRKKHIIPAYQAWRGAFPNFRFREELLERSGNGVRMGIYFTGTHRDTLLIPRSRVPFIDSTGTSLRLPGEYHTYYVENDKIVFTKCEIPPGHGNVALLEALIPPPIVIDTTSVE